MRTASSLPAASDVPVVVWTTVHHFLSSTPTIIWYYRAITVEDNVKNSTKLLCYRLDVIKLDSNQPMLIWILLWIKLYFYELFTLSSSFRTSHDDHHPFASLLHLWHIFSFQLGSHVAEKEIKTKASSLVSVRTLAINISGRSHPQWRVGLLLHLPMETSSLPESIIQYWGALTITTADSDPITRWTKRCQCQYQFILQFIYICREREGDYGYIWTELKKNLKFLRHKPRTALHPRKRRVGIWNEGCVLEKKHLVKWHLSV